MSVFLRAQDEEQVFSNDCLLELSLSILTQDLSEAARSASKLTVFIFTSVIQHKMPRQGGCLQGIHLYKTKFGQMSV